MENPNFDPFSMKKKEIMKESCNCDTIDKQIADLELKEKAKVIALTMTKHIPSQIEKEHEITQIQNKIKVFKEIKKDKKCKEAKNEEPKKETKKQEDAEDFFNY